MANQIQSMINNVLGDGARSTKFECIINLGKITSSDIATLAKTSSFPGKYNDVIDLKFKGRNIPIKGQTRYDNTWSCTFYLTETHALKKEIEDYIESLDNHNFSDISDSIEIKQSTNDINYTTSITIIQLDFNGTQQTAIYNLFNVFPKSVSAVEVDYSDVGKVQEFTVEFSYSHFESINLKSLDGSFVDSAKEKFMNALQGAINQGKEALIASAAGLIGNAKEIFNNSSSGFSGNIGNIIEKGIGFLEQIDFLPENMIE